VCKSSFFMSTECPGASSFTSPFNTFTYFQHKINQGAGDYTARAAAWQRTTRNASAATRNSSAAMNMYLRNGCICRRCTMPPPARRRCVRIYPIRTSLAQPGQLLLSVPHGTFRTRQSCKRRAVRLEFTEPPLRVGRSGRSRGRGPYAQQCRIEIVVVLTVIYFFVLRASPRGTY
jgi:hypothetical protein